MTPNIADFTLAGDWDGNACATCPECGLVIYTDYGATIRDLIGAASAHATTHTMSEVNA